MAGLLRSEMRTIHQRRRSRTLFISAAGRLQIVRWPEVMRQRQLAAATAPRLQGAA